MRTARCSGRVRRMVCPGREVWLDTLGYTPSREQNDWQTGVKHYLPATLFADGKNTRDKIILYVHLILRQISFYKSDVFDAYVMEEHGEDYRSDTLRVYFPQ